MQRCVLESMKDVHIRSSRPRGCHDSRASNRPPTAIPAGFMTYLMYAREGDEPLRLWLYLIWIRKVGVDLYIIVWPCRRNE